MAELECTFGKVLEIEILLEEFVYAPGWTVDFKILEYCRSLTREKLMRNEEVRAALVLTIREVLNRSLALIH